MSDHPSASGDSPPSATPAREWQLSGCLGVTVVVLVVCGAFGMLAWGCVEGSPTPRGAITPVVVDEAGLLTRDAIRAIEQTRFPDDVPLVVRTTTDPIESVVGTAATERMERETHWQKVRPRTWHQRVVKQNTPWGTGVYVLVSTQPPLMQVRFGDHIRLDAYRTGLAAGRDYRRLQDAFSTAPGQAAVVALVRHLSARLPGALDTPWYLSLVRKVVSVAFSEIEEFVLPADGAFRQWALRRYVHVLQWFDAASTGWRFIAFTAVAYCLIWASAWFLSTVLGRRFNKAGAIGAFVLSVLAKATYGVGAAGSLLLLANGRAEDEILLRNMGLQQLGWIGFDGPYFAVPGGWLLAIATGAVAFVTGFLETGEQLDESRAQGEERVNLNFLFAPFAWGALVLLLPRAVGIFAFLNRVAVGIGSGVRVARRHS
jgi:hypothetical protein